MPQKPKVLIYDIEISPAIGFYYPPEYEPKFVRNLHDWYVMSFSYKWLGEKKVHFKCVRDYDLYKTEPHNDYELLITLRDILDEADIVIGHNSDRFDIKKGNARFIKQGIARPSPYDCVDTLKMARGVAKFDSNRLDRLGDYLGIGTKTGSHYDLWYDCWLGDDKAWKQMKKYNNQDVILTEKVYLKLREYIKTHPNMARYREDPEEDACRKCGSMNYQRRGWRPSGQRWYRSLYCIGCGAWFKGLKGYTTKPTI